MRRTIAEQVEFRGIGLHSGVSAVMQVGPAPANTGIVIIRTDVNAADACIPARYDLVSDTQLCTKLTNDAGVSVSTVEHIMAALAGCGISDAIIRVNGPEIPIMDGSSAAFIDGFRRVGICVIAGSRKCIRILAPIEVESGGRIARLTPAPVAEIAFEISFAEQAIGRQSHAIALVGDVFATELADCRTFCLMKEVEALRKIGLARGGSLDNAIVVDDVRVLNPEGLRRSNEFVRHKILDAVGDLALAGAPIIGRYEGVRSGHEMTNLLLRALFDQPEAWEFAEADPGLLPNIGIGERASYEPAAMAV